MFTVFNAGPAAVRLNSRVDEAVFNSSMQHSSWLLIFNAPFAQACRQGARDMSVDMGGEETVVLVGGLSSKWPQEELFKCNCLMSDLTDHRERSTSENIISFVMISFSHKFN